MIASVFLLGNVLSVVAVVVVSIALGTYLFSRGERRRR